MDNNGDRCPFCDKFGMPKIPSNSLCNARYCQFCRKVEKVANGLPLGALIQVKDLPITDK